MIRATALFVAGCVLVVGADRASAQRAPTRIIAAPVIERDIAAGQTFVASVMPARRAIIGSAVDGRVINFPHDEGDRVEANQPIAQLLTETMELELAAAEAELEVQQATLAELENGLRPEEIDQMRARAASAEARKAYTEGAYLRTKELYEKGRAASQEQLDLARATAAEAAESLVDAQAAYALAMKGARIEAIARAKAQVAVQQAVVERLRDQIKKHTIVPRFPGYLVAEFTEQGQWVKQGDPVAEIAALDEVEIAVQVVEQSVQYIKLGDKVPVEIPALGPRRFEGEVIRIVPQADVRARTFPVKIRVQNEIGPNGPLIKSGMYARAVLSTGEKLKALLCPKDALVLGGATPIVYVVDGRPATLPTDVSVHAVPVELGMSSGDRIQVTGGLDAGDLVVVEGNERIKPGQQFPLVEILEATAPPSATASSAGGGAGAQ